jgi:hypothetical protein
LIEDRILELAECFSVSDYAYAQAVARDGCVGEKNHQAMRNFAAGDAERRWPRLSDNACPELPPNCLESWVSWIFPEN